MVIQEAWLDGFRIDRVLNQEAGIESHVVNAASIAVSRRHRRAKTEGVSVDVGKCLLACIQMLHLRELNLVGIFSKAETNAKNSADHRYNRPRWLISC